MRSLILFISIICSLTTYGANSCNAIFATAQKFEPITLDSNWTLSNYSDILGIPHKFAATASYSKNKFMSSATPYLVASLPSKIQEEVRSVWQQSYLRKDLMEIDKEYERTLKTPDEKYELRARRYMTKLQGRRTIEVRSIQFELKSGEIFSFQFADPSMINTGPVPPEVFSFMKAHGPEIKFIRDFHTHPGFNNPPSRSDQDMPAWFRPKMKKYNCVDAIYEAFIITRTTDRRLILFKIGGVAETLQ